MELREFWSVLATTSPLGVETFIKWLIDYRVKVKWTKLFGDSFTKTTDFYTLPEAMQIGIWIEFVRERGGCEYSIDVFGANWQEEIKEYIEMLEEEKLLEAKMEIDKSRETIPQVTSDYCDGCGNSKRRCCCGSMDGGLSNSGRR